MATDLERETAPQRTVQMPSLGRMVHYVAFGSPGGEFPAGKHRAALITNVYDQPGGGVHPTRVDLVVFNPNGYYFNQHVELDPSGRRPGSWHWPELVLPISG